MNERSGIEKTRPKRSRMGCYTCRSRKKKCDELLYPVCQNCKKKNLTCDWPAVKHKLNKFFNRDVYKPAEDVQNALVLNDGQEIREQVTSEEEQPKSHPGMSTDLPAANRYTPTSPIEVFRATSSLPPTSTSSALTPSLRKSYFLEKIALQQDIFEPEVNESPNQTYQPPPPPQKQNALIQSEDIVDLYDFESFDYLDPSLGFLQD